MVLYSTADLEYSAFAVSLVDSVIIQLLFLSVSNTFNCAIIMLMYELGKGRLTQKVVDSSYKVKGRSLQSSARARARGGGRSRGRGRHTYLNNLLAQFE